VFLETWYEGLATLDDSATMNREFWATIMDIRNVVSKELELSRNDKKIGSSLEAVVKIKCNASIHKLLSELKDELRFVFIASEVMLEIDESDISNSQNPYITVNPSKNPKCVRCWHQRPDVGSHAEHPELCGRCIENVAGDGEARRYA
jgi:isoleucyl-tRNA synthetase